MTWSIIPTPYGSVSFNGSSQYLTRANNALFNFGAGAFTVEAWVYLDTSVTTQQCIVTNYGSSTTGWSLQVENGKIIANLSGDGNDITGTTALSINQWYHVAISGATGSIKMFVNGNLDGTYTGATTLNSAGVLSIGRIATIGYLNGYISNLRIVNGVAVYTGAFTPPSAPLFGTQSAGTNIAAITGTQTSLLLNTPNNASFIADSSANNFTLTNNGGAVAAALTPFTATANTAWITTYDPFGSVSFNGSSQYLTTPANAALAPVTNFTVEAWIYANTLTSTNSSGVGIVFIGNSTSNNGRLQFSVGTDGTLTLYLRNNSAVDVTTVTSSAGSILIDTWYHVAGVRNGNNYTLYVNGNPVGTTTSATAMTYAANILNIGFQRQSNLLHYWNGYISNFRLTNGVAVYTGAFNVPRAPLQGIQPAGTTNIAAITGTQTSLLLNTPNNASFIADSSANNFTLTNNGGAVAAALTPFVNGGGAGWEFAGPENGSASFDGSTQYLSRTNNAAFNLPLSSGDFTVEAWIYITSYADSNVVYSVGGPDAPTTGRFLFSTNVTTGRLFFVITDTILLDTTGPIVPLNVWSHVALVRSGTTYTVWLNGASSASAATAVDPTGGGDMRIGRGTTTSTNYFNGFVSNLRLVKGVAVYTDAFTPPIRQLPAVQQANVYGLPSAAITGTQTSLLLNTPNNSQNIQDSSTNNFAITNNGAVPPSGISPFVPDLGSVSFNGTNQSLTIATNTAFEFGSGDFTVECWIYPISFNGTDGGFMAVGPQDGSATWIVRGNNNGTLTFTFWSAATTVGLIVTSGAGIVNLNVWNHIAVTRSGSTFTIWADGVSVATGTSASAISNTGRPGRIAYGFASSAIRYQNCYISNVRWVKGVAVYTGAFTPSTQPLPATQSANVYGNPSAAITGTQTSLLLNTPNNANFIKDSSTNGFTVTNNGAALATSLTPFSS